MKIFCFVISLAISMVLCHPQLGVKTHQGPVTGNLLANSTNTTYLGPPLGFNATHPMNLYPSLDTLKNVTEVWKNTTNRNQWFNRTRQEMSRGICYEEVPTVTLVANPRGNIPIGNGSNPSLSRIKICCQGYERNPHNFNLCDPICHEPCVNGLCVAPGTCACYPDYGVDLDGKCVPVCPIGCSNGDCLPDNTCKCKKGFVLDPTGKFCIEGVQCDVPCLNGYCTGYNKCTCHAGYLPHPTNGHMCMPYCPSGCPNGVCSGPNFCICNAGFIKDRSIKGSQACIRRV
ncbi:epidermal growth factor-like protein [Phlebotomus papatasi]|uniref:epidermal growth factor-like protein n=1 Tax=Phlebotomus papatasi TaxID=29031 RepID=UPI0024843509|nr:epidermal growth factor-like protein [Phlebotomus papatasi]